MTRYIYWSFLACALCIAIAMNAKPVMAQTSGGVLYACQRVDRDRGGHDQDEGQGLRLIGASDLRSARFNGRAVMRISE